MDFQTPLKNEIKPRSPGGGGPSRRGSRSLIVKQLINSVTPNDRLAIQQSTLNWVLPKIGKALGKSMYPRIYPKILPAPTSRLAQAFAGSC